MEQNTVRVRPVNLWLEEDFGEVREKRAEYGRCTLCGKKRHLRSFKKKPVCVHCLNLAKFYSVH